MFIDQQTRVVKLASAVDTTTFLTQQTRLNSMPSGFHTVLADCPSGYTRPKQQWNDLCFDLCQDFRMNPYMAPYGRSLLQLQTLAHLYSNISIPFLHYQKRNIGKKGGGTLQFKSYLTSSTVGGKLQIQLHPPRSCFLFWKKKKCMASKTYLKTKDTGFIQKSSVSSSSFTLINKLQPTSWQFLNLSGV